MNNRIFSYQDILQGAANRQEKASGTTIAVADTEKTFFICSVIGTTVTIADDAGTTVMVINTNHFNYPFLKLPRGFTVSAAGTVYITYFWL